MMNRRGLIAIALSASSAMAALYSVFGVAGAAQADDSVYYVSDSSLTNTSDPHPRPRRVLIDGEWVNLDRDRDWRDRDWRDRDWDDDDRDWDDDDRDWDDRDWRDRDWDDDDRDFRIRLGGDRRDVRIFDDDDDDFFFDRGRRRGFEPRIRISIP